MDIDQENVLPKVGENNNSEDFKKILQENSELIKELAEDVKYIKKYIFWQKIRAFIYLIIIIAPIIFGFIFLQPYLQGLDKTLSTYTDLLNSVSK